MAASNIKIQVFIHKKENKVLFAEADSDFVDILFSFMTLPMGTILRLLASHSDPPVIGSFNNLYGSMENLDAKYFVSKECKNLLLNIRNSAEAVCQNLKINIDAMEPYFVCEGSCFTLGLSYAYLSTSNTTICLKCNKVFKKAIEYKATKGVFVADTALFVVTNDLCVIPSTGASILGILESSGITDFKVLEEKTLKLSSSEILDLLKYSFLSRTPLTDLVFGKKCIISPVLTNKFSDINECMNNFKNMNVKVLVLVQKSSNKILLAQSSEDFVYFLFSFLTIPLGRVISLLSKDGAATCSVENIHRSIFNLNIGEHFISKKKKDMLLCPQLAAHYLPSNQLFPLSQQTTQQTTQKFYWTGQWSTGGSQDYNCYLNTDSSSSLQFQLVSPKGQAKYSLNGPTKFMVMDDLTVTPFSTTSFIAFLQSLKIPPSDVEEQVINIGMEEGMNLLRASLTSASVLTSGLEYCIPKKWTQEMAERLPKNPKVEK